MSLSYKEIEKIANLSRIKLNNNQIEKFGIEISEIMKWIDVLEEVDTDGVPRMSSVANISMPSREDSVTEDNCQEDILSNATDAQYACFSVPKVIEES